MKVIQVRFQWYTVIFMDGGDKSQIVEMFNEIQKVRFLCGYLNASQFGKRI
ncbi:hypothetical protein RO3G_09860 [Rhizopus delemar RA 99-880]|uniref:Uncharacterized protein n=1 Tax=Rhizopus delemar (strain RA 99-880 / ATCC MYA-4621 / FGSC 9543 / NRRL 43880) TaxID=246409 RepID=I1C9M0_RHIO9|nr:hypothetical protein RO3G_09860 [Rhizopus delemar RA 99-880]|eukprot:EIE85150.1 hypothetical protein RO3G_09860 [Rhizopus delemar RA 99-880]